jgi:transcriptional pleiotropic regulator of transition state genes
MVSNLKSTGIVRKVDDLGRVVIPIELRKILNIDIKDGLEVYVDGDCIVLRKYEPSMDSPKGLLQEFLTLYDSKQPIPKELIERMRSYSGTVKV